MYRAEPWSPAPPTTKAQRTSLYTSQSKCKVQAQAVLKELFPEADGERYGLQVALAQHARASDAAGDDDSNHAHDNEIAYTMADSAVGGYVRRRAFGLP